MRRRDLALDVGIAVLTLGMSLAVLASHGLGVPDPSARHLDGTGVLLAMASTLPLAARRFAPLTVYLVTAAASIALLELRYPLDFPFGCVTAAYFLSAAYSGDPRPARRWAAMLAVWLFVPAAAATHAVSGHETTGIVPGLVFWALIFAGAWIVGDRTRLRRERISELEERALRTEREAARERRLAAAEERTRIARELHDSAAHAINIILVQAGAARLLHQRDPGRSQHAIATIEQVARATIGEIDGLVHALRDDTPGQPEPADPAAIDELLDQHRAVGLAIAADLRGSRHPLPRSVAWATYRILQEALTNAARHGRGSAEVAVWFQPDVVAITVTNPAAANGQAPGGGHGIVGMRERASLLGGDPRHPGPRWHLPPARPAPAQPGGVMTQLRVLIADDDDLMRAGLKAVLSSDDTIEVVAEAGDGREAVSHTRGLKPDVVLMDVRMPGMDGITATREIIAAAPGARILILTTFEDDDYVFGALTAGASGFLLKRTQPEQLIAAIHTIAAGESLLSPSVTRTVINRMASQPQPDPAASRRLRLLTPRERDVLELVARGLSNAEIAASLFVEESTVKTHLKRILAKLSLRDRVQAVILAYETGLARPAPGTRGHQARLPRA